MAMERPKAGQTISMSLDGTSVEVKVLDVWDFENKNESGFVVEYQLPDGRIYETSVVTHADYSAELSSRSGMPYVDVKGFKWGHYNGRAEAAKKIANSFIQDWRKWRERGMGLYIASEVNGSGKTYLACCIAMELIKRYNTQVEFVTVNDYVGMLTEDKQRAYDIKDSLLLIVDDIGAQNEKQDWIRDSIFRLIDHRYREKLPTIFTSNMPINKASTNDRVTSRIFERSHMAVLPDISVREILAKQAKEAFLAEVMA